MPLRGGQFSILFEGDQQYVEVTCDDGRAFTVGPADAAQAAIDNGPVGLRVCANPGDLAEMSLPETGARWTRAQLEAATTATLADLAEPLEIADLQEPPSGREDAPASSVARSHHGSYTTWSVTTRGWSAACNGSSASGSGSGLSSASAAGAALLAWLTSANCPPGGGTYGTGP